MKCLHTILKGLAVTAVGVALAVGAVWVTPAQAQYVPDSMPITSNLRALIVNSWSNLGMSGGNQEWGRGARRNSYPWNGTGPGYFGAVLSQFTSNQKSQNSNDYKISGGEGIWLLNADKGSVSVTGPRGTPWQGQYLVPLPYDPKGQPEESWGVQNPLKILTNQVPSVSPADAGANSSLSNYWPGVAPLDDGSLYGNLTTDGKLSPGQTRPTQIANYTLGGHNLVDVTKPEETIIARWVDIKNGIQVTRRVYDWSNPDFDDFYIVDLTFTNTGDFNGDGVTDTPGTINNLYISFKNSAAMTAMGMLEGFGWDFYEDDDGRGNDDMLWFSESGGLPAAFAGWPGMKAVLRRDGDNPVTSWDDTGDPFYKALIPSNYDILQTEGQPRAPSTYFFAPIAFADAAGAFSFNDWDRGKFVQPASTDQPISFKWWHAHTPTDFDDPTPTTTVEADLAAVMQDRGFQDNANEVNPEERAYFLELTSYGPYTLAPGESAKIVLAWGAGHPSQMKPIPANQQDAGMLLWDRSNATPEAKIAEIKTLGPQAALENLQLAHWTYDNNYQVPASPTEAYISASNLASSGDARQLIRWDNKSASAVNPYSGEQDILGYRVYRSTWFNWGPWELKDVVGTGSNGETVTGKWAFANNVYEYEDLDSAAGFSYFYSVRPYAKGVNNITFAGGMTVDDIPVGRVKSNVRRGYESGWAPATARTYDGDERKAFQPVTSETNALSKQVLVVPNPYFVDGIHTYPNSRNIRFVGLPAKCRIHIYSASGDRVQTIEHDDPNKGEDEFRQIAFNIAGEVQTGLYYFVVVNETGQGNRTQRGSFVLIK